MAKIMLFGASSIFGVPNDVLAWLQEYTKQGHEFIVGDRKGSDSAFHKALSSIGAAQQTTIYCMDYAKNNTYDLKTKTFVTSYNEETQQARVESKDGSVEPFIIDSVEKEMDIPYNRQWYEFRDRQMINDCDIAIGLWDGESKTAMHIIQLLNIKEKPCYTFSMIQS
jgi:hypothetical protein